MKLWRLVHITVGIILAPFLFITALTGTAMLIFNRFWQHLNLHAWFRYGGIVIGLGLILLAVTGLVIFIKVIFHQKMKKTPRS
jgi:uncharacterized iron-regulated membrane protein